MARAQDGHGSLLVVEGPAGIGKSALIGAARAAVGRARARGRCARAAESSSATSPSASCASCSSPRWPRSPPAPATTCCRGRPAWPGGCSGCRARAPEGGEVAAPDASFTVLHGLYWLCANLSGDRPLVLTVDDAHWADAPSLRFLAFLLPRLEELSLALVVATRPEAESAAAPLLALLLADPLARVLRPAPLSAGAVGRLVEEGLGRAPDPDFAAACQRTTGGVPFLVRELVEALREEGVAPTAAEAPRVEALGARTVGRAMLVRLSRLPPVAVRLAQAVAVLETAELAQAADLAGVDADEAADGRRPPRRREHPRAAAPAGLRAPDRARRDPRGGAAGRAHARPPARRRAARRARGQRRARGRAPAGDRAGRRRVDGGAADRRGPRRRAPRRAGVGGQLPAPRPGRAAGARGARPDPARARRGRGDRRPARGRGPPARGARRRRATTTCASAPPSCWPTSSAAASRSRQAIEVIDLAAARLADNRGRARVLLESMATGAGMLDAATAPRLASRMRAMRRAADHAHVPREVLAVAALVAVHANEPAPTCIALAQRALAAGPRIVPEPTDLPWFAQATVALVWADAHAEAQAPLDAGVAESRATGDPALFGMSLSQRAWLLLRQGDLQGAEGDARTLLEAPERGRAAAVPQAGGGHPRQRLGRAGPGSSRPRRCWTASASTRARRRRPRPCCASRAGACAWPRTAPPRRWPTSSPAAGSSLATGSTCPGYLAWRSAAALAHAALGEREEGLRAGHGGGRARARLRRPAHARGLPARRRGGRRRQPRARRSCARASSAWSAPGIALERARALAELGVLVRATAGARRRARCCARRSTSPTTRAPRRWPTSPRPSCAPPAPSRGAWP